MESKLCAKGQRVFGQVRLSPANQIPPFVHWHQHSHFVGVDGKPSPSSCRVLSTIASRFSWPTCPWRCPSRRRFPTQSPRGVACRSSMRPCRARCPGSLPRRWTQACLPDAICCRRCGLAGSRTPPHRRPPSPCWPSTIAPPVHFHGCGHVDAPVNPLRGGQGHGPATSVTSAPWSAKAEARAKPIFPLLGCPEAHGVERLVGGAGGDEHLLARPGKGLLEMASTWSAMSSGSAMRPLPTKPLAKGQCRGRRCHPARFEDAKVVLGGSMCEHVQVHGWGHGHGQRALRSTACNKFSHWPCTMAARVLAVAGPRRSGRPKSPIPRGWSTRRRARLREVGMHGPVDQRGQRQRRDEFGGASGHHHTHLRTTALQFTRQRGAFVRGNAPGDAQDNASSRKGREGEASSMAVLV